MRTLVLGLMLIAIVGIGARAQQPVPREPAMQKTTVGSELFKFYCSNCHGLDGRGRPAASADSRPAADLTLLAINHGGIFPREAVRDVILHGAGPGEVHGTREMPVWGTIFRALEPSDALVDVRIDNLVRYIESLQSRGVATGAQ